MIARYSLFESDNIVTFFFFCSTKLAISFILNTEITYYNTKKKRFYTAVHHIVRKLLGSSSKYTTTERFFFFTFRLIIIAVISDGSWWFSVLVCAKEFSIGHLLNARFSFFFSCRSFVALGKWLLWSNQFFSQPFFLMICWILQHMFLFSMYKQYWPSIYK